MLNYREVLELFPDCQIIVERVLRWPKSYFAVRHTPARACSNEAPLPAPISPAGRIGETSTVPISFPNGGGNAAISQGRCPRKGASRPTGKRGVRGSRFFTKAMGNSDTRKPTKSVSVQFGILISMN